VRRDSASHAYASPASSGARLDGNVTGSPSAPEAALGVAESNRFAASYW
jgi:hypothetical protein